MKQLIIIINTLIFFYSTAQGIDELAQKAMQFFNAGRFQESSEIFEQLLVKIEGELGKNNLTYALCANALAKAYENQGLYTNAEFYYHETLAIIQEIGGTENDQFVTACENLAAFYKSQKLFDKAESFLKKALDVYEKLNIKESDDYIAVCRELAAINLLQSRYAEAEFFFNESKKIIARIHGTMHHSYLAVVVDLAKVYVTLGRYSDAENLLKEDLETTAKMLGKDHPDYAISCNNLAHLYKKTGRYHDAEKLFQEALTILQNNNRKESIAYASACDNLASLYDDMGFYSKAELLTKEALEIRKRVLGTEHPDYATSCNNLAGLYANYGRENEAIYFYAEAKEVYAKSLGRNHPHYASVCNNLAVLLEKLGDYEKAEKLYRESFNIRLETLGKYSPDFAVSCANLAMLFQKMGRFTEAESLFKEAKEVFVEKLGKNHPYYRMVCNNLAGLYEQMGQYDLAQKLYHEAVEVAVKILGKEHPDYALACSNLALFYETHGRYAEAEKFFKEDSRVLTSNIQRNFIGLSEKEREQYLSTLLYHFESYYSFVLRFGKPELAGWLLENSLNTRALLFFSNNQLRRSVLASNDEKLKSTYESWLIRRIEIAKAIEMGEELRRQMNINIEDLEKQANEIEKQLSVMLTRSGLPVQLTPIRHNWQELKRKLKNNEALVEMVRIRYYENKWTDSILYVALVVKRDSRFPQLVVFPHGNNMEAKGLTYYRNCISFNLEDNQSYKTFYQPLEQSLHDITKVYFSADGVYHQLNLETLFNPTTQKYLGEEIQIQLISTARDLLRMPKRKEKKINEIYLFGYPDFAGKAQGALTSTDERNYTDDSNDWAEKLGKSQRFLDVNTGSVSYLPGTKKEIESIETLAKKAGLKIQKYLADQASEENLKAVISPGVLHIATHGFFIGQNNSSDQKVQQRFVNPLLRSGLLFAGAELTLKKEPLNSSENGILTSQEALNLSLQSTVLVVLSACETGLGEIKAGEGVFGLQRALQEAGAKSVIMSLWKVDDSATQEMMSLFYENLLIKKQDKRVAFFNAQMEMKKRYIHPYYWGAFVLVGE